MTQAVVEKIREVCTQYLQVDEFLSRAEKEIAAAQAERRREKEIAALQSRIDSLSQHLDKMYMDKLSGILDDADFQRIYLKVKVERGSLEQKLKQMETPRYSPKKQADMAKELVQRFLATASVNRELMVSLIDRVELTADKQIIIKFRFSQLENRDKTA